MTEETETEDVAHSPALAVLSLAHHPAVSPLTLAAHNAEVLEVDAVKGKDLTPNVCE